MTTHEFVAREGGQRVDVYLANALGHTRSYVQNLLSRGLVSCNGKQVKANYKLRPGDRLTAQIPAPKAVDILPEAIPLDIVYEDNDILVVNKPKGMVVHPAAGNEQGTLVNGLLFCTRLSGINGELRPGIVHRLDKDTSGLLVVAKSDEAHQGLAAQLKERTMHRTYLALAQGNFKEDNGTITGNIGRSHKDRKKMAVVPEGREAVTHYRVLERFGEATLLQVQLETGRTHQIRVHLAYKKHPILGDPLYGNGPTLGLTSQALHAARLELTQPITHERLSFTAPLPEEFQKALAILRKKCGR